MNVIDKRCGHYYLSAVILTLLMVSMINFGISTNSILIYPNPNHSSHLTIGGIVGNDASYTLELRNVTGKLLYINMFNADSIELPVIDKGVYLITIYSEGSFVRKIFKYIVK